MEDYRSKSYNANGMQIQPHNYNTNQTGAYGSVSVVGYQSNNNNVQDFRSYSTSSYATSSSNQTHQMDYDNPKLKKNMSKSTNGSMTKTWSMNDPELQRKKRVASYKAYTVEGKVKGSIKKSFRWIKDKYSQMVYGMRS